MNAQTNRLPTGGRIDRRRDLRFTFDGTCYTGYAGDTLASALLANDVSLLARSFKYHRPRGIFAAGPEEPNALVTLGEGAAALPNTRATTIDLVDGLVANSQNAWPSLRYDIGAINGLLSGIFSAGFYYKTFMWPGARGWRFYEHFIRRAAGMGSAGLQPYPAASERIERYCDVLVVGAGPAGLAAALVASRAGMRVLLVDENTRAGGAIARGIAGNDALRQWTSAVLQELADKENVSVQLRCTAFGYYDGNVVGLLQSHPGELQRHTIVRAGQVVLATGALERPLLYANNDLPGNMLASAAHCYLNEYAVRAGRQIVIYTNNDSAYTAAAEFAKHASVVLVDVRDELSEALVIRCRDAGVPLLRGARSLRALGRRCVSGVEVAGHGQLSCDLLLSSAGWTPTIHLHSQAGSLPVFDDSLRAFLPGTAREAWHASGACDGVFETRGCLESGRDAAARALGSLGAVMPEVELPHCDGDGGSVSGPLPAASRTSFLDLQNDVTLADIEQAAGEGYRSAELLKRYTTLGMGTDQGKTSNVNALELLAATRGEPVPGVGITTFRPPYTPIGMGAIAGAGVGAHVLPTRYTPLQPWHEQRGAMMTDAGLWKRPLGYPRGDESRAATAQREAAHVRNAVATCDVSTLGKLLLQGPDAAGLLERLYVNRWSNLGPARARYGVMLRDDGFVFDDGTTSCLAKDRYFMTTTTDHAEAVLRHIEFLLQVTWPDLRVCVSDVTDQWAGIAVAGPRSRELLMSLFGTAVSADALPFMGFATVHYEQLSIMVLRVSFSGELGFELYVPSSNAQRLMSALYDAGSEFDIQPYGLDAMDILRIEKGHLTGAEIDGNRTLGDLGLTRMARNDPCYIGAAMSQRPGLTEPQRMTLVGLLASKAGDGLLAGAHLVDNAGPQEPSNSLGHVTSACFSPALQKHIALALLQNGQQRRDSTVYVSDPLAGTHVAATVVSPHFVDPAGERLRA